MGSLCLNGYIPLIVSIRHAKAVGVCLPWYTHDVGKLLRDRLDLIAELFHYWYSLSSTLNCWAGLAAKGHEHVHRLLLTSLGVFIV